MSQQLRVDGKREYHWDQSSEYASMLRLFVDLGRKTTYAFKNQNQHKAYIPVQKRESYMMWKCGKIRRK